MSWRRKLPEGGQVPSCEYGNVNPSSVAERSGGGDTGQPSKPVSQNWEIMLGFK